MHQEAMPLVLHCKHIVCAQYLVSHVHSSFSSFRQLIVEEQQLTLLVKFSHHGLSHIWPYAPSSAFAALQDTGP